MYYTSPGCFVTTVKRSIVKSIILSLPSNYFKDLKMSLQPPIAGVLQKNPFAFAQALFCTSLIP